MRHQMANRKLGRTSAHRSALFRNQISSMIQHERIVTTLIKAKELRPLVEKMVTLGKDDSVHARRQAARTLTDRDVVQKLFSDISARFNERPGGYTRIVKLGPRRGDGAEMAILEFVDFQLERPVEPVGKQAKAPAAKKAKSDEKAEPEAEEKPKKARKKKKSDAEAE